MNEELTFGQKQVGVRFNPSGNPEVDIIKEISASLIDQLDVARKTTTDPDKKRLYSEAITNIETGCMFGVKAATW